MIASIRGVLLERQANHIVIEAGGIGYEILVTAETAARLPSLGHEALLHIVESFGMYGGGETLYGFLSVPEKMMFLAFKEHVSGTGAKKALEFLEKAAKSLPDFRRAVIEKDAGLLTGVFGFSRKSADKIIESLKDKLESVAMPGSERIKHSQLRNLHDSELSQAVAALSALGYKAAEARVALQSVSEEAVGDKLSAEQIVRLALKKL